MEKIFDIDKLADLFFHSSPILCVISVLFLTFFKWLDKRFSAVEKTLRRIELDQARNDPKDMHRIIEELRKEQQVQAVDIAGLWEFTKTIRARPRDV